MNLKDEQMIHFDCHAHVYEKVSAVPGARYAPKKPAPLATWMKNLNDHNLIGGVIVQVSFLGTDNSELCAALSKLDKSKFAGVAVVDIDVGEEELGHLATKGIRGVRWNLVRGAEIPDLKSPQLQAFLGNLREQNLHIEVHLEGPSLAKNVAQLADQGLDIVIDHFGLPSDPAPNSDPFFKALSAIKERENIFMKLSAPYRTTFDLSYHLKAVRELLPASQLLWGSDWPHTQHEQTVNYQKSHHNTKQIKDFCDKESVKKLYGISIE